MRLLARSWYSGTHRTNLGTQACVPGVGLKLLGSELGLIRAGLAASEPQKSILAWVVTVGHMGQEPEKPWKSCNWNLSHLVGRQLN